MLVLGRKAGQIINIDDDISVIVLDVDARGYVTLGFDAPKDVAIWRAEIDKGQGANT
jgi:carbon storage regulator CsrA